MANVFSAQQRINNNLLVPVAGPGTGVTIGASGFVSVEKLSLTFNGTTDLGMYINESTNPGTAAYITFGNIGTVVGSITQNGSAAVSYNTTSDIRLKEDLKPLVNVRDMIASLTAYDFHRKADAAGRRERGFIAQEVYKVMPDIVTVGGADAAKAPWQMDYAKVTPVLWANARDANERIARLEQQVMDLKFRLKMREAKY